MCLITNESVLRCTEIREAQIGIEMVDEEILETDRRQRRTLFIGQHPVIARIKIRIGMPIELRIEIRVEIKHLLLRELVEDETVDLLFIGTEQRRIQLS